MMKQAIIDLALAAAICAALMTLHFKFWGV
jgi:hypothetical protein